MVKNNKFIGYFKTETEYRPHECVVLTYAIPLNRENTEFDYENSLVVDLTTLTESAADYLRSMCQSDEALSHKTFMDFAHKREYSGRQETILNYLHSSNYIRKVPSSQVKLIMGADGQERDVSVEEINEQIRVAMGDTKPQTQESVVDTTKQMIVEDQNVPYIERVVEYGSTATQPNLVEKKPSVSEEVAALREDVARLTSMLEAALAPKKAGRPPKNKDQ